MLRLTSLFIASLCCYYSVSSQSSLFADLSGDTLLDKIVEDYRPTNVLRYSTAKDVMYAEIYNVDDSVSCVYSGHTIDLPSGIDPSVYLYTNGSSDGINAEHTYPRSKGAAEVYGNGYSDLHHLFPTRSAINTSRDNFPFGEIDDDKATSWFSDNKALSTIPSDLIDNYSERINGMFEPREDHKGNVARAIFYFYTMYEEDALDADPDFFENQRATLCRWHIQDPADDLEIERTHKIAAYQDGLANPFVIDCSLSNRTYCQEFDLTCASLTTPVDDLEQTTIKLYPSPVVDRLYVEAEGQSQVRVFDMTGRQLMSKEFFNQRELDFTSIQSGTYIVVIKDRTFKIVK